MCECGEVIMFFQGFSDNANNERTEGDILIPFASPLGEEKSSFPHLQQLQV